MPGFLGQLHTGFFSARLYVGDGEPVQIAWRLGVLWLAQFLELSGGLFDRTRSFEIALINALAPFYNEAAYE